MASEQYKIGTVTVTNASQIIIGASTDWLTEISTPAVFKADIDGESTYSIGTISSATRIILAANYLGSTNSGIDYMICRSFTANRGYWRPLQGDYDFSEILSQETIDEIDEDIHHIMTGAASVEGTITPYFKIDKDGNSARLYASFLTASRDFRFPDQNATLVGLSVEQNFNASQRYKYVIHGKSNASIDGTLSVAGNLTFIGNLWNKGNASIDGTLDVSGISHFRSTGSVDGKLKTASTLWGKATASIDGALNVTGAAAVTGKASTASTLWGKATASIDGALNVTGAGTITGNLWNKGNASFDGTLDVAGITHARSTASVDGDLNVNQKAIVASTIHGKQTASIDGDLTVTQKILTASTLWTKATASIDGDLKVGGTVTGVNINIYDPQLKTSNYQITSADNYILASGNIIITLASASDKQQIKIANRSLSNSASTYVRRSGGDAIENATYIRLASKYDSVVLNGDGSNTHIQF